jgi:hypothetical protein
LSTGFFPLSVPELLEQPELVGLVFVFFRLLIVASSNAEAIHADFLLNTGRDGADFVVAMAGAA